MGAIGSHQFFISSVEVGCERQPVVPNWICSKSPRELVINNSRILYLSQCPNPDVASRILSYAARQVATDWLQYYFVKPLIVETFVEPTRFEDLL